jgi:hypothetical protein
MGNDKNNKEEKGFVIKDRRFSSKKEEESQPKEEIKKEETQEPEKGPSDQPLPEIDFMNLVFSFSTSALIQLGEIQDPMTQQVAKNLPLAKQTIDIIGMLNEKTKGNLTKDEEKVMENILYDLKLRYVKAAS